MHDEIDVQKIKKVLHEVVHEILDYTDESNSYREYIDDAIGDLNLYLDSKKIYDKEHIKSKLSLLTKLIEFNSDLSDKCDYAVYKTFGNPEELETFLGEIIGSPILRKDSALYFYHLIEKYSDFE